ncbi:hypothetical protein HK096_010717, partial [Nowakowskiella sp. JEL0078]
MLGDEKVSGVRKRLSRYTTFQSVENFSKHTEILAAVETNQVSSEFSNALPFTQALLNLEKFPPVEEEPAVLTKKKNCGTTDASKIANNSSKEFSSIVAPKDVNSSAKRKLVNAYLSDTLASSLKKETSSLKLPGHKDGLSAFAKKKMATLKRTRNKCLKVRYDAPQEVVASVPEKQVPVVLNSQIKSSLLKQTTNVNESDQLNCKSKETSFQEPAEIKCTKQEFVNQVDPAFVNKRPRTLRRTRNTSLEVRYDAPQDVVAYVPEKQVPI